MKRVSAEALLLDLDILAGHKQVTDAHLLGLAVASYAILVTFDRRLEGMAMGKPNVRVLS